MRYPVTIETVNRLMRIIPDQKTESGYLEWRGEWQREMLDALVNYPEVVIQASRQVAGKTFTVGMFEAARIIAGNTVTIGYPTLAQSSRLLGERITGNVNTINKLLSDATGHKLFRQPREQVAYQRWQLMDDPTHEGKLYSLSANEIAVHKPEGYTTDDLDLDEAHRQTEKTLGIFEPFTDIALEQGNARIVYIGIGGHKTSLIEQKKLKPGVKVVRWPASRIMSVTSKWDKVFEQRRASMSDWQWRQHYECLQSTEGMRLMYPEGIPGVIDVQEILRHGLAPILYFGIDVGKIVDYTVVKVISVITGLVGQEVKKIINEVDTLLVPQIDYTEQAIIIKNWIDKRYYWKGERIVVELNGPGQVFYDVLGKVFGRRIRGITSTAELKEQFWHETTTAIRDGRYGCVQEESRLHYEGMTYEYKQGKAGFKMEFEHSDHWMALCMAWLAMQTVEVL